MFLQMKMLWVYITACCTPEIDWIVTLVVEAVIELAILPVIFNDQGSARVVSSKLFY